jgi:copper chaperone CopZ
MNSIRENPQAQLVFIDKRFIMLLTRYSRCSFPVVAMLVGLIGVAAAEDSPRPEPVRYQVTGLFSPDRVQDLRALLETIEDVKLMDVDYEKAEAAFLYDRAKVFPNAKEPGQELELFDTLLRQASRATFGIKPVCAVSRDKLQLIKIPVVGLDCKGCSLAAYEAIFKLEGVEQATASFKAGLVTAWVHPDKFDQAALKEALTKRQVKLVTDEK